MKTGKRILAAAVALGMVFGMTSVLPEEVTAKLGSTIEASAESWEDYEYYIDSSDEGEYAVILAYTGTAATLNIPSAIGKYEVRSISSNAFSGCTSLKTVTIPDSVTSIDYGAFENCTDLESITLPANITQISFDAFCNCTSLKSITIPEGVTYIDSYAFQDCTSLTSVSLPSTLSSIDEYAFVGCTSLKELTVPNRVKHIGDHAFGFLVQGYDEETYTYVYKKIPGFNLKCGSGSAAEQFAIDHDLNYQIVEMPKYTYHLDSDGDLYLDSYTGKETVVDIPSEIDDIPVYGIEYEAFCNNPYVQTINIPATVRSLNTAFDGCTSLTNINVDPESTSFASYDGVLYYSSFDYLHRCPPNKTSVKFADGVTIISGNAFERCTKITSLTLPEGITNIEGCAFDRCTALKSITLPSTLRNITYDAFLDCPSLKEITIPNSVIYLDDYCIGYVYHTSNYEYAKVPGFKIICGEGSAAEKYADDKGFAKQLVAMPKFSYTVNDSDDTLTITSYCGKDTEIDIPSMIDGKTVTEIGSDILRSNATVKKVNIPSTIENIDSGAFSSCPTLLNISVDEDNSSYCSYDGALYNSDMTGLLICPRGKASIEFAENTEWISSYAFEDCTKLTSVTIPEKVTEISSQTFANCTSLTTVTLPEYLDEIDYNAFCGCTSLSSINIPEYVAEIWDCAFQDCPSLKEITIPNSVTYLGYQCLGYVYDADNDEYTKVPGFKIICGEGSAAEKYADENGFAKQLVAMPAFSYNYNYWDDTLQVISYTGKDTSVTIPSEANGKKVTDIGSDIFKNNKTVKTVNIPAGISEISSNAFNSSPTLATVNVDAANENYSSKNGVLFDKNCTDLICCPPAKTSVSIPDTVTNISSSAFKNCTKLKTVTLPSDISFIGSEAFKNCTKLKTVTLPSDISYIGSEAFSGCTSLESITIPDKLSDINEYAFYGCTSLKSVTLGNNPEYIDTDAFCNCPALKEITLPNSLTYFDYHCLGFTFDPDSEEYTKVEGFKIKCGNYSDALDYAVDKGFDYEIVDLPKFSYREHSDRSIYITKYTGKDATVTIPSTIDGHKITGIDEGVFADNTSVKTVVIENGIRYISGKAFSGCTNLSSVTIPESVSSIELYAFYACPALKTVTIPNSVKFIGQNALGIIDAEYDYETDEETVTKTPNFKINCGQYSTAEQYAKDNGFAYELVDNMSKFIYFELEDGTLELISYTGNDASVTVPKTANGKAVTSIGDQAFYGNKYVKTVTIQSNIKQVGTAAFQMCENLTKVTLPEGLKAIAPYTFNGCSKLTDINLPSTLITIGNCAFMGCSSLSSVTLPDGLTEIGPAAFANCSSLKSITIPKTIRYLYASIFNNCTSLENVVLNEGLESLGSYTFSGCTKLTSISIPSTVKAIYEAFNKSGIRSLHIPATVVEFHPQYLDCPDLETITIEDSKYLPKVYENAIYSRDLTTLLKCPGGKSSITFPAELRVIGSNSFSNNSNITTVTIPSGVTTIGNYAFSNSNNLMYVDIPDSVTIIDEYAFENTSPDLTIRCHSGSAAEAFAKEHNIKYLLDGTEYEKGDINHDGSVSLLDVVFLSRAVSGVESFKKYLIPENSFDGNNTVTRLDVVLLSRRVSKGSWK